MENKSENLKFNKQTQSNSDINQKPLENKDKIKSTNYTQDNKIKQNNADLKQNNKTKPANTPLNPDKNKPNNPPANSVKPNPSLVSEAEIKKYSAKINDVKKEIAKVVIGQRGAVDSLMRGLLCNGHVLLEGVPGIAKTLLILVLGKVTGSSAKRVQFTVDLLPSDIVGITTYTPEKGFEVIKGPIFANFIVADEINRSPPKTQSALLEAMQEKNVTIGKETFSLPNPFFVMATENPIETSGVYFLPEAQVDRFLFKVIMGYPERLEEKIIMEKNMTLLKFEDFKLDVIITPEEIIKMQQLVKSVYSSDAIKEYILRIVDMTRSKDATDLNKYIEMGASPRAAIGLFIASKAEAFLNGRNFVIPRDIKRVAGDVLRHRIILNYLAQAEKITTDTIISAILNKVEVP